MPRYDAFLEALHHHLSTTGCSPECLRDKMSSLLARHGRGVPFEVVEAARALEKGLAEGGLPGACAKLGELRGPALAPEESGLFRGEDYGVRLPPNEGKPPFTLLSFYVDPDERVQLVCEDYSRPLVICEPRHARFAYHAWQHQRGVALAEAIKASGSTAVRHGKVFDESRVRIGLEWFSESDLGRSFYERIIRFGPNLEVSPRADCIERRVRRLLDLRGRSRRRAP